MKRCPVSRPTTLLWLTIFLAILPGFLHRIYSQQRMITAAPKSYFGEFDIPRLPNYSNTSTPLADWPLWNLRPIEEGEQGSAIAGKSPYDLKLFGDILALYRVNDPNERWEFYGVYYHNGKPYAVFYNPSKGVKGWIVPGIAEELCPGLRLTDITENRVVLVETRGEVGKTWNMTLFPEIFPINGPPPAHGGVVEHR